MDRVNRDGEMINDIECLETFIYYANFAGSDLRKNNEQHKGETFSPSKMEVLRSKLRTVQHLTDIRKDVTKGYQMFFIILRLKILNSVKFINKIFC